jgi:hypothetical protein
MTSFVSRVSLVNSRWIWNEVPVIQGVEAIEIMRERYTSGFVVAGGGDESEETRSKYVQY